MKKIAASDSRQSVGLKWKMRKNLEKLIGFEGTKTEVGGDMEVDGKAYFCGKDALIYHGSVSTTMEGTAVNVTLTALMMNGPQITVAGEQQGADGPGMLILASMDNAFMVFLGVPLKDNGDGTTSPATLEDVYNDNWNPYISMDSCKQPVMVDKNGIALIDHIFTNSIVATGEGTPLIDKSFAIDGTASTLGDVEAKATGASQAKYQHTVTIKGARPAQGGGACFLTFTAYSSKNTPIDSAQDLIDVFGGCDLSVSGMYSPAQGTNFGAIKLMLQGASTIADASLAYIDPGIINEAGVKMSECGNLSFSDDVCIPK